MSQAEQERDVDQMLDPILKMLAEQIPDPKHRVLHLEQIVRRLSKDMYWLTAVFMTSRELDRHLDIVAKRDDEMTAAEIEHGARLQTLVTAALRDAEKYVEEAHERHDPRRARPKAAD